MLQIEKYMSSKVYFAEGAGTSKAGLQRFIAENQHKEIIIIDKIEKMPLKDQEGLLSIMERGEFTSTKVRNTKTVRVNIVIFATSDSTNRLCIPLLEKVTKKF
jgi:DNA-binding NtrC family response regulator